MGVCAKSRKDSEMKRYQVYFDENGGEYIGFCYVDAEHIAIDIDDPKAFYADGVRVEMDERIIRIIDIAIFKEG